METEPANKRMPGTGSVECPGMILFYPNFKIYVIVSTSSLAPAASVDMSTVALTEFSIQICCCFCSVAKSSLTLLQPHGL